MLSGASKGGSSQGTGSIVNTYVTSIGGSALEAVSTEVILEISGLQATYGPDLSIPELHQEISDLEGGGSDAEAQIDTINSEITVIENNQSTDENNITTLQSEVSTLESTETSQGTSINNLESSQATQDTLISNQGTAITNLQASQTSEDTLITNQGAAITTLQASQTSQDTLIMNEGASIFNLDASQSIQNTEIASLESTQSTQGTDISALQISQDAQDVLIANEGSDIATLETSESTEDSQITVLNTNVSAQALNIGALELSETTQDSQIASLQSTQATHTSQITTLQNTQTSEGNTLTTQGAAISTLEASQTTQDAQIANLQSTETTEGASITSLEASQAVQDTAITNLESVQTTQGAAITTAVAQIITNTADISTLNATAVTLQNEIDGLSGGSGAEIVDPNYSNSYVSTINTAHGSLPMVTVVSPHVELVGSSNVKLKSANQEFEVNQNGVVINLIPNFPDNVQFDVQDGMGRSLLAAHETNGPTMHAYGSNKIDLVSPASDHVTLDNTGIGVRTIGSNEEIMSAERTSSNSTLAVEVIDPTVTLTAKPLDGTTPTNLNLRGSQIVLNPSLDSRTVPNLTVSADNTGYGILVQPNPPPLNPAVPTNSTEGCITFLDGAGMAGMQLGTIYTDVDTPISFYAISTGSSDETIEVITGGGISIGNVNFTNTDVVSQSNEIMSGFDNNDSSNLSGGELVTWNLLTSLIDTIFPIGCLQMSTNTTVPSSFGGYITWTLYAAANGKYLKMTNTGATVGTTQAASVLAHTHSITPGSTVATNTVANDGTHYHMGYGREGYAPSTLTLGQESENHSRITSGANHADNEEPITLWNTAPYTSSPAFATYPLANGVTAATAMGSHNHALPSLSLEGNTASTGTTNQVDSVYVLIYRRTA